MSLSSDEKSPPKTKQHDAQINSSNKATLTHKAPKENDNRNEENKASVIESLCMNCHKQGETRLLLINVPFFKEIVVMSFECENCGFKNNNIQMARELQEKAVRLTLKVTSASDFDRMIVINENAELKIPEIDFEVPKMKKAVVSTIQGIFELFLNDLCQQIDSLKEEKADTSSLEAFVSKLKYYSEAKPEILPYSIILTDYSGNSFISKESYTVNDDNLKIEKFYRTKEKLIELGYLSEQNQKSSKKRNIPSEIDPKTVKVSILEAKEIIKKMQGPSDIDKSKECPPLNEQESISEATEIPVDCYSCFKMGNLRICKIEIPFFKEMLIMAFVCDHCGFKNTEIKPSGRVSEKGRRIKLTARSPEDLNRDLFKSDSVTLSIPELELELSSGTLGSFYTTVEGLIDQIIENLGAGNPFIGDSAQQEQAQNFKSFMNKLTEIKEGKLLPFTLIMDDPLDNCFLLNPYYPEPDLNAVMEVYERTAEQNEELGFDQMSQ